MNGAWLGTRAIRTNWATKKPPAPVERTRQPRASRNLNYDDVYNQASDTNCTVYVGGIQTGLSGMWAMHCTTYSSVTVRVLYCSASSSSWY